MKKLVLSILTLIPIIGPILYLLLCDKATKREKVIAAIGLIPVLNVICAILLIITSVLS